MDDSSRLPIGIFDSGVGGLTVLTAVRERLPDESLIYLGDTAPQPLLAAPSLSPPCVGPAVHSVHTVHLVHSVHPSFAGPSTVHAAFLPTPHS